MTQIVAFESAPLPSFLKPKGAVANPFAAVAGGGGYKVVSIKGKNFHIVDGESRVLVERDDGSPASAIEAVIIAWNPNKSKVYYKGGYVEGSTDKPLCYSNNGVSPEADATEPQSNKCATCPHNVFGSKITESGAKAKACADSLRVAIAQPDLLNDPMLLRVPAASLADLGKYGHRLAVRGAEPHHVITRISFDFTVAFPKLTFDVRKQQPFVSEEQYAEIEAQRQTDLVKQIIGVMATPSAHDDDEPFVPPPAPKVTPVVEEERAKPAKPAAKKAAPADDLPAAPKGKIKVEDVADEVGAMVDSTDDLEFDD